MDFSKMPNEDLHALCVKGCTGAWNYLYWYVMKIARSPKWRLREAPEDIVQSIICHLLTKGIDSVREPEKFRSFVGHVAVNFILDTFKKQQLPTISFDENPSGEDTPARKIPDKNPGPEEIMMGNGLLEAIRRGIGMLREQCRDVLEAYIDYKLGIYDNYRELAASLGRGVGTLSAQIKRCLDKLRKLDIIRCWLES